MKINESYMVRRGFLCRMLAGGGAALGAGMATPIVYFAGNLREEPLPTHLELEREDYDLAPGTGKIVSYGRIPALLIRPPEPDGSLKVFVATCTHFDCTVGYRKDENRIVCACHDGYYDLDGQVVSGPPPRPLQPVYHAVHGGKLILALEKENLEKALQHDS